MENEKRLIDMDVAIERAKASDNIVGSSIWETSEVVIFLEDCPTVDAVEVVHGRWEPVAHDGSWRVDMCSICHRRMHYVDYDQPYQYCPNCGARMDLQ